MTTAAPIDLMLRAAIAAIEPILSVYAKPFTATQKSDGSPVTEADAAAERAILEVLALTGIPVLAEESVAAGHIPVLGERFFVVDPLDGTKEFLKRNGEFTINIALCEHGRPRAGVVLAPVTGSIFWGDATGAFSGIVSDGIVMSPQPTRVQNDGPLKIVTSRSHGHAALAQLCSALSVTEDVSVGSSLKFCLLAEGKAQLYPRFTPTSEWDTAAGQAVLEAAGGVVLDIDGQPLTCGHPDRGFLNGWFIAAANARLAEAARQEMLKLR